MPLNLLLRRRTAVAAMGALLAVTASWPLCAAVTDWQSELKAGIAARERGDIAESLVRLDSAEHAAPDPASRSRARMQSGMTLLRAGRLADADRQLQSAQAGAPDAASSAALLLGRANVAGARHDSARASELYQQVVDAGNADPTLHELALAARLDRLRLQPAREQLRQFADLKRDIDAMPSPARRAHAYLLLGVQADGALTTARLLSTSPAAAGSLYQSTQQLARDCLNQAAALGAESGKPALKVEAEGELAQLQESLGKPADALKLNEAAIVEASALPAAQADLQLTRLQLRSARLSRRLGDDALARVSYLQAAGHLQAIRQDLPLEDDSGQSTYQTVIRPIFLGLADLNLLNVDSLAAQERDARLRSVLDTLELTHQAELQDYLGDRCSVDSARERDDAPLAAGVAVLYTAVLKDRLEVILRVKDGVFHHAVNLTASSLEQRIAEFRGQLLDPQSQSYLGNAQQLYAWLLAPFDAQLEQSKVRQLVVVPDGALRLVPFAALHDGHHFVAERFAVAAAIGLSLTDQQVRSAATSRTLLAGLAEPGPVVDRLATLKLGKSDDPATLRKQLALPGAQAEIERLTPRRRSVVLLNQDFTVSNFRRELSGGQYSVIHIASHGFFGASSQQSFLLAYDGVITIDDLQQLIGDSSPQDTGIELLTLSACDTAAGDDRAPLGFAGAAIKARARSVVATLWAVDDAAEKELMQSFYGHLSLGKGEAIAQAQRTLIGSEQFSHPYYWAPVELIGAWN
jgi:CHAT domain-containing protein